jgi:hypothetical protein
MLEQKLLHLTVDHKTLCGDRSLELYTKFVTYLIVITEEHLEPHVIFEYLSWIFHRLSNIKGNIYSITT